MTKRVLFVVKVGVKCVLSNILIFRCSFVNISTKLVEYTQ